MGYWGVVNNSLKNADVILLIIDSRVPKESINTEVVRKAKLLGKEVIFVFNKTDLVSKNSLEKLRIKYKDSFFVNINNRKSILEIYEYLKEKSKNYKKSLRVAIVGYPNVGKSSILNIIAPKTRAKVSAISGTTKKTQWIRLGNIRFMDTPGVIPRYDSKTKLGITASKDAHKLKNPEKVAYEIIKILKNKNPIALKEYYRINFDNENDEYDIFYKIGLQKKFLIKGGEIDENRTAIKIIEDWQKGKIKS